MYVPKSEPCVLCMTRMCLDPATWYSVLELEVMLRMLPSLYHMTRGLGSPATTQVSSVSNPRPLCSVCFSAERISAGNRTWNVQWSKIHSFYINHGTDLHLDGSSLSFSLRANSCAVVISSILVFIFRNSLYCKLHLYLCGDICEL